MGIIIHARIKDGIIKTDEDLKKLGMEGEKVILEIRRSKIDEIEKRLVQSKKELIDESIEMTEYGVDIEWALYIPESSKVFIDSNIFTHFLLKREEYYNSTKNFLKRIDEREIIGLINSVVISETYFNYIRIKISEKYRINLKDVVKKIKEDPKILGEISIDVVDDTFRLDNLNILEYTPEISIKDFIADYLLLPNDAIHAATCKYYGIKNIATNDSDFERVNFLKVWKP